MLVLILGLIIFIGLHLIPALPRKRHKLVKRLGENKYKGLFSLGAALGLGLIIYGFYLARLSNSTFLYYPPEWLKHMAFLLVLLAFLLLSGHRGNGYIRWYAKHPQIAAVKLWAVAHLLMNGDLPSVILFGSFLAWAIFARISMAKRERFGLIKTRDFEPNLIRDIIGACVAIALYLAFMFTLHQWLIGVPVVA